MRRNIIIGSNIIVLNFGLFKIIIVIILVLYELFFIFPILKKEFVILKIYIYKRFFHHILVEVNISGINSNRGPGNYIRGINQVLPFIWRNCSFISSSYNKKHLQKDLYFFPIPNFKKKQNMNLIKEKIFKKFILGPNFVPMNWNSFPDQNYWYEKNFLYLLNLSKGIVVHSERVRDYLSNRTNASNYLRKFKIIRPCTNLKPYKIKSFKKRKIDILFFEKYADLNRSEQGGKLLNLFKNTSKRLKNIKYGEYNKEIMEDLASNSKFIIYFSFFDTGAIGLKEIQNYGVIAFSLQKEFIIDNETSYYIPELANIDNMELAFNKIMKKIEFLSQSNINTYLIAKKNQMINKCENALIDLCKNVF